MVNLSPFTGLGSIQQWATQFTRIEEESTKGATTGTDLKKDDATILNEADVITNQGTANDANNLNGNAIGTIVQSSTPQLASGTVVPGVRTLGNGSSRAANPLTATDAGSDATVNIAAHTNFLGDGTGVAYNSGSITGLAFSTIFFIFADDPTFAGGAVTYVATTAPEDLGKALGRYYVGSLTTPADGAGDTGGSGGGGGGGAPGGGGGEIP